MASKRGIIKERAERKNLVTYGIVALVLYLYGIIVWAQVSGMMRADKRMEFGDALSKCIIPIHFGSMFPLPSEFFYNLFIFTLIAGLVGILFVSDQQIRKENRPDNDDAHFMTLSELKAYNIKMTDPIGKVSSNGPMNMIFSEDIKLSMEGFETKRNCNIIAIGGSGAGKSRFFAAPNILQCNTNFVITDPSGELLRDYGKFLEDFGYNVKVFNLTDISHSHRYNPLKYIREEKDVFLLINTLIKNTTPPEKNGGDAFWEKTEKLLLQAIILYLWHTCPPEEQTFAKVVDLVNEAEVDENDASTQSELDKKFERLRIEDPTNLAVKQYTAFKKAAGKTLKSIIISVVARVESFMLNDLQYLTNDDDFDFETFADSKQAIFVVIPTAEDTFNFIVSLLYSQLFTSLYNYVELKVENGWMVKIDKLNIVKVFQAEKNNSDEAKKKAEALVAEIKAGVKAVHNKEKDLYYLYTKKGTLLGWRGTKEMIKEYADSLKNVHVEKCKRRCPYHVRFMLDEFANIGQLPQFDQKLATIRKYEISCSIILQAISQLKAMYDKTWNTIMGNCDTKIFLGSDDSETMEWLIKMLGKKLKNVQNSSQSYGKSGSSSTSINGQSTELISIDQLSLMEDTECLVRIRGERPYFGKKYDLLKHPNYSYAQSTCGKFKMPVTAGAGHIDTRPFQLRKKDNPASQSVANNINNMNKKKNELKVTSIDNDLVANKKLLNKKKKAEMLKKQMSKEKLENLKKNPDLINEVFEEVGEKEVVDTMCREMNITPGMTDTEIIERATTYIDLKVFPESNITYGTA